MQAQWCDIARESHHDFLLTDICSRAYAYVCLCVYMTYDRSKHEEEIRLVVGQVNGEVSEGMQ